MGSLMPGWNSPVPDPKYARHLRNRSFIKAEIENFQSLKKKMDDEHLKSALLGLQETCIQENEQKESGVKLQRSKSLPSANIREKLTKNDSKTDLETITRKNALWTRSSWAFLNEPPVILTEAPSYKYASHYHVSTLPSL